MKRSPILTDDRNPTKKKKKRKYIFWNTDIGYETFQEWSKAEGHTMVDTLETWLEKNYNSRSKPPVLCGKCGARNESARIDAIIKGQNIGCACRHQLVRRTPDLNCKKGDVSVNYVISHIQSVGWEVAKMREATTADLAVRRTGSDGDWLPIQVKSCSTGSGRFQGLKGYSNMILCLVELNKGEGGDFWIGRRDAFPQTNVGNIRGKNSKDTYERFRVLDASNLNARLHSFDTDPYIKKRSLDYLNVPSEWTQRKEHLSQTLFRSVLRSFGHTMTAPEYENTVIDWFLNGSISVQDKTIGASNGWQYFANLHKSNGYVDGNQQFQPYASGDNDFYLFFVLDQEYKKSDFQCSVDEFVALTKKASLRGCYAFREAELIATGHIATATQPGKINIRLPVPNANGTFKAKITRGAMRNHNFEPHYFHKTNFKRMVNSMLEK